MGNVREINTRGQKPVFRDQLVTVADLEDFKSDILLSIRNMLSELKGQSGKKWLKSYEVKKLLEVSTGTLQNLRDNGTLPFTKMGGTIYYSSEDIDNMLLKLKKQTGTIKMLNKRF